MSTTMSFLAEAQCSTVSWPEAAVGIAAVLAMVAIAWVIWR